MAGKTGEKIDYSLRVQKNVERKILGDVIRSLNYFDKVEKYRYIGFGSFYYKDFLLLHEKYNIHSGISVEIDNRFYANKADMLQRHIVFLNAIMEKYMDEFDKWIDEKKQGGELVISTNIGNKIVERLTDRICDWFIDKVTCCEGFFSGMNFISKGNYDFKKIKADIINEKKSFAECIQMKIDLKLRTLYVDEVESEDSIVIDIDGLPMPQDTIFDPKEYEKIVSEGLVNRYTYNKPYGFIKVIFKELLSAYEHIEWNDECKNIIWLDYDIFISEEQLEGLEKSILNARRGDLIIFSTSMGNLEDKERCKSLNELRESSQKIVDEVKLKDCHDKGIPNVMHKIVHDLVKATIIKKNTNRPEGTPEFNYQPVVECTYKDGMPMYTYGFVVYNSEDNIDDEDFPGKALKDYIWFPTDNKIYEIYVPALTHKEVNAINQLLPVKTEKEIEDLFPFIKPDSIKKYKEIWRYYPNYLEVDGYV